MNQNYGKAIIMEQSLSRMSEKKVMECSSGRGVVVFAKVDLCGVCCKGTRVNCVKCKHHKNGFLRGALGRRVFL